MNKPKVWNKFSSPMPWSKFQELVRRGKWQPKAYRSVREEYEVYVALFNKKVEQDYTCEICGYKNEERFNKGITVHHIKHQQYHPELADDPDNLVCLCHKCHSKVHNGELKL
jgi:5-methylcytosine-specific restriction endonuclease McrA